jgi:hypothetical protein
VPPAFTTARFLWEDGAARVRTARPDDRVDLERAVDATVLELRRRLGRTFRVDELVDLYNQGTDWVGSIAVSAAPDNPNAWDEEAVAGAAFWRHAREAGDFAGGRRLDGEQ